MRDRFRPLLLLLAIASLWCSGDYAFSDDPPAADYQRMDCSLMARGTVEWKDPADHSKGTIVKFGAPGSAWAHDSVMPNSKFWCSQSDANCKKPSKCQLDPVTGNLGYDQNGKLKVGSDFRCTCLVFKKDKAVQPYGLERINWPKDTSGG